MPYSPGSTFHISFYTTGLAPDRIVDPLTPPTGIVRNNGATDGAVTVSFVKNGTGDYTASAAIPSSYLFTDSAELVIAYSSGGGLPKGQVIPLPLFAPITGASIATLTFHDALAAIVPNVPFSILASGVIVAYGQANTSGVAAIGLPNGTYSVVAAPTNGILFTSATLVVSGTTALTITGSSIASVPAPVLLNQSTVYAYAYDGDGSVPTVGKVFWLVMIASNTGGDVWSGDPYQSEASDTTTGLASASAQLGGSYQASLDGVKWTATFTVSTNPYHLAEIVGPFRDGVWR